ncbi:MAG: right-handed parallel beta-helix repeat-containing protein, partial [Lachnospiraceae bacterium]|nr:right-handed parallel beta-helix repeat-containing protein [Lachnospiraceae bacterium]
STQITVKIPEGSYKLAGILQIYSYTTLDATGCTLTTAASSTLGSSHNLLRTGDSTYNVSSACAGYGGFTNVTVKGGTWKSSSSNTSTIMRFIHATNVSVENVTLDGGGCTHQMEVAAINGFTVTGCTFQNHGVATSGDSHENQEVIQLDIPVRDDVLTESYQDGTVMMNVSITGNTFSNVYRGVGTHTMLYGAYHQNIDISDNTFVNVYEECIICLNYYNCTVKNNTITNCGGGILIQNFKVDTPQSMNTTIFDGSKSYSGTFLTDLKTTVSGNTITLKYGGKYGVTCANPVGIQLYGAVTTAKTTGLGDGTSLAAGSYYVGGVTITNNTITTLGNGIYLTAAKDCTISGNTVKQGSSDTMPEDAVKYGVFVENSSTGISVTSNKITSMQGSGICVQKSSSVTEITGNTISSAGDKGININGVNGASSVTGAISGNTISKAANGGIVLSNSASAASITGNTITGTKGDAAITVAYSSTVSGTIGTNTITDTSSACEGIKITESSTVKTISKNKIKKSSNTYSCLKGIIVYKGSTVSGSITGNTIKNAKESGIVVSTGSSKVKGSITSNTITKTSTGPAISIYNKASSGAITKNTITNVNSGQAAIRLQTSATASSITYNEISKTSGTYSCKIGIQVYNSSTVSKSVSNNSVTDAKSSGIAVSTKSKVKGSISS